MWKGETARSALSSLIDMTEQRIPRMITPLPVDSGDEAPQEYDERRRPALSLSPQRAA